MTAGMQALVAAIDARANEIYAGDGDGSDLADARGMARALARTLAGQSIPAAFGAPGDWGYFSSIGKALLRIAEEAHEEAAHDGGRQ
jgi:hypothetical protein